jgi:TonB family protein
MDRFPRVVTCFTTAVLLVIATAAASQPGATAPRLRSGPTPEPAPEAFGAGEVLLEATVAPSGAVAAITPLRDTPPFTERLLDAVSKWQFAAGTAIVDGKLTAAAAPVLVVGAFRAPTLYAGPAPGAVPQTLARPSARVPALQSVVMPNYPAKAVGDGFVIVEIEMTRLGVTRGYRVITTASGFDLAALDAVRAWRFTPPSAATAERLFVYAVIGFRSPVTR